ncbi:DUF2752 domain-containing protein [Acidobacteriota bacterium]
MSIYLTRPGRDRYWIDHELIWGSIGLFALLVARLAPLKAFSLLSCPFKVITGLPCFTCGLTRTFLHMVRFQFSAAFALNPVGTVFFLFVVFFVVYAMVVFLFKLPRLRVRVKNKKIRLALRIGIPLLILANWIYLIVHGA